MGGHKMVLRGLINMIYHMSGGSGAPITPPVPTITIAPSNWTVTSEYSLPRGKVLADTKKSATVSLPTQTGSAPSIGVSANGLITSSYSVPAGKLLSGGASASAQLATQGGYTVMPGTSDVTAVAQGRYTTGNIYVKGDSNLVSSNIISGKSIFGVSGSAGSVDNVRDFNSYIPMRLDQLQFTFSGSRLLFANLFYTGPVTTNLASKEITQIVFYNFISGSTPATAVGYVRSIQSTPSSFGGILTESIGNVPFTISGNTFTFTPPSGYQFAAESVTAPNGTTYLGSWNMSNTIGY